jgi:endonuclease YncB( thermonuclease family)
MASSGRELAVLAEAADSFGVQEWLLGSGIAAVYP